MIYGFWLHLNNEKSKALQAPEMAQDVLILVGSKNYPIGRITRSEIDYYLTPEFFRQYDVFEKWKLGFGLPRGLSWDQQPLFIMDIVTTLEGEYKKLKRGD